MVQICEKFRIECDFCDKVLKEGEYIKIYSNDFGYSETQQESHYCSKDCMKAMIETWKSKYDEDEYKEFSEYWEINKYLTSN